MCISNTRQRHDVASIRLVDFLAGQLGRPGHDRPGAGHRLEAAELAAAALGAVDVDTAMELSTSQEALAASLLKLSTAEVKVRAKRKPAKQAE